MRNIWTITQSEWSVVAVGQQVGGPQSLITPLTVHVKPHIVNIEEEHCLAQRLDQELFETTYRALLLMLNNDAGIVTPTKWTPFRTFSGEERRRRYKQILDRNNQSSKGFRKT